MHRRAHPREHRSTRLLLGAAVGLVALLAVAPAASAQAPGASGRSSDDKLRVLYMGDSLAFEAREYFGFVLKYTGRAAVDDHLVFGGTAICDWLDSLGPKLKKFRPDIAVVEFAGNAATRCMQDASTGQPLFGRALVDKYQRDADAAMKIFSRHDVVTYWVNPPESCAHPNRVLTSVYIGLASRWDNARYIDTNDSLTANGICAFYLPCLDGEPCDAIDPQTGEPAAAVRAPDGLHFCPGAPAAADGVTATCGVWSSGAWRYATAVAAPIIDEFDLTPPTAPLLPPPSPAQVLPGPGRS